MEDHDQRFKTLIREFFADFMHLFFAAWAACLDLSRVTWLDKEVLPNPPKGSRHILDMVARISLKSEAVPGETSPESTLALVHIEVESPDHTTEIKPRLPAYYVHLRDAHGLPVLSIVVYLKVGLDGIGMDAYVEKFQEIETLRLSYLYVGLPGLNGLEYVKGDNWLGVALAALMRIPRERVVELGVEALRRLSESPLSEQKRFLLADCVEAYLPLDDDQRQELDRRLTLPETAGAQSMNKTTYEKGIEKGIEKGATLASQKILLRLGTRHLGTPSPETESQIREVFEVVRLENLIDRVSSVKSWDELLRE